MVLNELNASREVGLVELIGNVPAQRAKLPPLLYCGVEEGYGIQHGLPLGQVGDVQLLLGHARIGTLEPRLNSLWRLIGELDTSLKYYTKHTR